MFTISIVCLPFSHYSAEPLRIYILKLACRLSLESKEKAGTFILFAQGRACSSNLLPINMHCGNTTCCLENVKRRADFIKLAVTCSNSTSQFRTFFFQCTLKVRDQLASEIPTRIKVSCCTDLVNQAY